jgi:Rod binding domain-containing protein
MDSLRLNSKTNLVSKTESLLRKDLEKAKKKRLWKVAKEFEAMLIYEMIKAMRATLTPEKSLLYGGHAEDIFQEMLDREYANLMSSSMDFGLATQIYNQMSKYVR